METTVGGGAVVGEKRREKFGGLGFGFGYAPLLYGKTIRTDEGTLHSLLQPAVLSLSQIPNLGGGAASTPARGVPFTAAQWQELHRQALIYKHFVYSVPLPPHLLVGGGGGGGLDPEAGRCKRTDGKKWRCSRDAAPEQKYCERHMHRGRPRSRKPVEQKPRKSPEAAAKSNSVHGGFFPIDGLKPIFQSMESVKKPRYIDWMKGEETEVFGSSNQWELPNLNIGTSSNNNAHSVLQPYDDQLNLYLNEQSRFFPFIDAWSSEAPSSPMIKHDDGELPLSTLSLSMYGGTIEESSDQIEMANNKAQAMNWMRPASSPGGPLAEALQSSRATSPNNALASSSSSASGVLQRGLVSLSDSSAGSSPTFAGACRSEIALQWLKQRK